MCGIAGVVQFEPSGSRAAQAVDQMTAALRHRGPDSEAIWEATTRSGASVAFGHTRLAIIDLSEAGRQPMVRGAAAVTFNGEVFNYRSLRSQLTDRGAAFRSQSDTEVLLAAYAEWGAQAVLRLDGMFAFGVWDAGRDRLLLARDRFGVKPLYYYRDATCFVFASEVRALLASGLVPSSLDPSGFWHYLGYQTTPTPATLLRDVKMLEPGCTMEVTGDGRVTTERYWDLLAAAETEGHEDSPAEARRKVSELLGSAVTSHLISDVPVGVFLSGGIDSGALVSVVRAAGVTPQTFTVTLDEGAYDESAEAGEVARLFHTEHTDVRLRGADLVDMLPEVLRGVDHPSGDGVNTAVVSRAVRDRGVKVALSGLGGDELFGGYPSFRRLGRLAPALRHWGRSPRGVRRAAAEVMRAAGGSSVAAMKAAAVMEGDGSLARTWPVTRQLLSERERRRMLSDAWCLQGRVGDPYGAFLAEAYREFPDVGDWARVSYAEARCYMHDVLLRDTDQMSMAHGLEVRVPLLDHRLAAYVVSLPDRLKHGVFPKSLLVESLPGPLPHRIVMQPKKGFTLPFEVWMRGPLRSFCEANLLEDGLDGRGLFNSGQVGRLWQRFLQRAPGLTWSRIWTLVALNAWLERQRIGVHP